MPVWEHATFVSMRRVYAGEGRKTLFAVAGPRAQPRPPARSSDADPPYAQAPSSLPPDTERFRWSEPGQVLQELDSLTADLLPRRRGEPREDEPMAATLSALDALAQLSEGAAVPESLSPDASPGGAPPVPISPPVSTPAPPAAELDAEDSTPPTLYLEERLRLANLALTGFGQGIKEMDERWSSLRQTADTLSQEIHRAQRELEFVRGSGVASPEPGDPEETREPPRLRTPPPTSDVVATVLPTGRVAVSARRVEGRPLPSAYGEFTASRYNRTIGDLKARRKKLAGYTIGFATLISLGLLVLTAIAREPMPAWWVAALPAVWMVPVPFFIASFRGTHRVLRRNHLELAAD